jgi:molybdopterin-guanine dinucleotide biosynthesis protein A
VKRTAVAGIFVGGAGARMGGRAKGLLRVPDGRTIVERWCAVLEASGIRDIVLVGTRGAYAGIALETIDDEPGGIGPLGGLIALLRRAGDGLALALACDMPFVSESLVRRLVAAGEAPVVAPRRDNRWEPLFAQYDAQRVLPVARRLAGEGAHSLQRLLEEVRAVELPMRTDEMNELRDWDTPEDMDSL